MSIGSLFGITRQSLVMPNSDPWDPYLTLMSDSYMPGTSFFKEKVSGLFLLFFFFSSRFVGRISGSGPRRLMHL